MVKMHTSTLVTSICTLSLKAFCRFMKHEGNALNPARSTLLLICLQFLKCKSIQKCATFIWMVKMHTSGLVTSICTLSVKVFCRFIKYKGNALKYATSTLFKICSYLERCISIQESPNIFIWMVKMHTSTLVSSICTLSLFCLYIKHKRNALKDDTLAPFHICSHFDKCITMQKSTNLYMNVKNSYFNSSVLNLYITFKVFSHLLKHKRNAINALHRHFSTSVYIWKSVYQYRKVQTFIWMVKMHTSTFVTTICIISLKAFCRFIKHKRNALKDSTSTLF